MKFLHFSDTHLGKTNYKLSEREKDFYKVFKQCVDIAISQKVDFAVHTGDFFDRGNPSHRSIIQAIRQLKRLKEAGIPVFIISGSHDMSMDETAISILEEIGLVKNIAHPSYYEVKDNSITMKGFSYKGVFMCGMAGRQANIQQIFKILKTGPQAENADYKIFMLHHTISDISTKFMDIPTSLLPKGFDYYAAGHWHSDFTVRYDRGVVQYAGSTEYTDATDMESGKKKQVLIVDTKTKEIKHVFLDTRPINITKIDCSSMNPKQVTDECIRKIKPLKGGLMLLRLSGRISEGSKNMIDRHLINEAAKNAGYLHCKIYLDELLNPNDNKEVRIRSSKNVEEEFLKAKGYSEGEIRIARIIIELMGRELSRDELLKAKERVIEEIER